MPTEKLNELLKKPLTATGTVALVAAKDADGKPDANGNKSMTINAYNGGLMDVGWGLPVGIDLAGVTWRDDNAVPILCQHDAHNIDAICGQAKRIKCEGSSIMVEADFMPVSETAKKVHELAKAGFKFQASVGVTPSDVLYVDAETAYNLNGAEVKGECYIVRAGLLHEVSIVPLGADNSTATAIAAASQTNKENHNMDPKNAPVQAAKEPDTATVEAALKAERDRVASISKVCEGHADIMAQAVEGGWTAEKAELACLKAEKAEAQKAAKEKEIQAARPGAPAITGRAEIPHDNATVTASICMAASMKEDALTKLFNGVDLNAAADLKMSSISKVFAQFGCGYDRSDVNSIAKSLKAAFSTADIPNVLTNAANKFVLAGFGATGETWRKVVNPVAVSDFKAVKGVRLVMGGVLQPLTKGGELQHVALSDESRDLAAATKGSIIGITREDLINDNLSVLANIPTKFGAMSARTINKDVFGLIAGLANSAFGATASGALSFETAQAAYDAASAIKDSDGNPIVDEFNRILVSPANRFKAQEIFKNTEFVGGSTKAGKSNLMAGVLEPIVSPWLSGTKYWIFNSAFPLVDVAFLNGRQAPVVETAEANFSQLGIEMRCYFDYGCAAGETKAALVSTGA